MAIAQEAARRAMEGLSLPAATLQRQPSQPGTPSRQPRTPPAEAQAPQPPQQEPGAQEQPVKPEAPQAPLSWAERLKQNKVPGGAQEHGCSHSMLPSTVSVL
jgi:hypothetical protein